MEGFLLVFIPIFVAIDPFGLIPMFLSLTDGMAPPDRRKLALQAGLTALIVSLGFAVTGNYIFKFLGISPADFRIAGGLILLIISIQELFGKTARKTDGGTSDKFIGVVPIGIPLLAGPALMTTLLILLDYHSLILIILALISVIIITFGVFYYSDKIAEAIGEAPSKVIAKLFAIFLAAIGVMMVRLGLETIIREFHT